MAKLREVKSAWISLCLPESGPKVNLRYRCARVWHCPAILMVLAAIAVSVGCQGLNPVHSVYRPDVEIRAQSPDVRPAVPAGLTLDNVLGDQDRDPDGRVAASGTIDRQNIVANVTVRGNRRVAEHRILANVRTRPGRYFDPDILQQDVNQLWRMSEIQRVNGPWVEQTSEGVNVTIEVVEKQTLSAIKFVGNRAITDRRLKKEAGIQDGQPLDVFEVKMIKSRIEDYYRDKGFPNTQVEILEGTGDEDDSIVMVIHEDQQQRIWNVKFEGNTFATDSRLKTLVKSRPGVMWMIGGLAKRTEIDQDVQRLTSYYKSFGYFNARIGRDISESNDGRWLTTTYIIDEGPRYTIRNISFMGNDKFTNEQLAGLLKLKAGDEGNPPFNAARMNQDVANLRDLYGSQGYIFSQVEAEPRFLEQPGEMDLVYKIDEGEQYRVGKVNVHIDGNYGVTRRETVLNRINLRPGDLIDSREIRNSERRLGAAQIFAGGDPGSPGAPPRIVVKPPELRELERMASGNGESGIYR